MNDVRTYLNIIEKLYGIENSTIENQIQRYEELLKRFKDRFGDRDVRLFSAPGRIEIGGNHTDHNHGRVLAASINLDAISAAAKNDSDKVTVYSEGYEYPFSIDLNYLDIVEAEQGTTTALIRGTAARLKTMDFCIGGFDACAASDVLPGSGLSSSASIEVLIGQMFNSLFNENKIDPITLAKVGQYAENVYFGKPCGLMDQTTSATGGIITIDFKDPENPDVRKVPVDFNQYGYRVLVVDTGGDHADLTVDYASIPDEMKAVALELGGQNARDVAWDDVVNKMDRLRQKVGDRAILRTLHFLGDHARVLEQVEALEKEDFSRFLNLVNESGNSSYKMLQNVYSCNNVQDQGVSIALALTESYLSQIGEGAVRVHGGGFAGTILVFLPEKSVPEYTRRMNDVFGEGSVLVLNIRRYGAVDFNAFSE